MAERRMFAKTIIDSDAFLEMPISARLLYYDLSMRADDDGFNNSPRKVMRTVGATTDDMNILIARKFIIPFENGVVVIKHWRIHNYIRKDTYKETNYKEEKALLEFDENNAYRLTDGDRQRTVNEPSTQVRLGQDRLGQDRLVEVSENDDGNNTFELMGGTLGKNVILLTPAQHEELLEKLGLDAYNHYMDKLSTFIIEKGAKVSNHYATILKWAREDAMI